MSNFKISRRNLLTSLGSGLIFGHSGYTNLTYSDSIGNNYPRDSFMFGTSTAAHQIEGGLDNNWSRWAKNQENIENAGEAINHYNKFRDDYDMSKKLNNNAHRLSIAWSRIMPDKNTIDKDELLHYKKRVKYLNNLGIEPIISLWHFSHPKWFMNEGGWVNGPINKFYEFVNETVKFLSDDVNIWISHNEPQGFAAVAYLAGIWPNYKNGILPYLKAEKNMVNAIKKTSKIINKHIENPYIGSSLAYINILSDDTILGPVAKWFGNHLANYRFIDKIKDSLDFIGINYYFNRKVGLSGINQPETSAKNTPPFPNQLENVLVNCWNRYNLPIIITETGTATGHKREWYIRESIKSTINAINSGVPVYGYLYWTLLDCYEWHSGWGMNFGLIDVDRKNQNRSFRDSSWIFSKISERYIGNIIDNNKVPNLNQNI